MRSLVPLAVLGLAACGGGGGGGLNLFTLEDDVALGGELAAEVNSNPDVYGPVIDESANPEAYAQLQRVTDHILNSGMVEHRDEFVWQLHLIDDDETLNAFAAPGGYIYVYSGLVHYLDTEDHFAGVMGHEIAHADQRHSTEQLTKAYGLSVLAGLVFGGDPGVVAQVATGLLTLSFSRADEAEADDYSVVYLCETPYAADGAAGFFAKLLEEGAGGGIPEFLSTHPSPDNRVQDIEAAAAELGCSTDPYEGAQWAEFQSTL
jgi:predicted Zn-dependent protease